MILKKILDELKAIHEAIDTLALIMEKDKKDRKYEDYRTQDGRLGRKIGN